METRWTQSRGDMLVTGQWEVGEKSGTSFPTDVPTAHAHTHPGGRRGPEARAPAGTESDTGPLLSPHFPTAAWGAHFPLGPEKRHAQQ